MAKQTFRQWCEENTQVGDKNIVLDYCLEDINSEDFKKIASGSEKELLFKCQYCGKEFKARPYKIKEKFKYNRNDLSYVLILCKDCTHHQVKFPLTVSMEYEEEDSVASMGFYEPVVENGKMQVYEKLPTGELRKCEGRFLTYKEAARNSNNYIYFQCKIHGKKEIKRINNVIDGSVGFRCCKEEEKKAKEHGNTLLLWMMLLWNYSIHGNYIISKGLNNANYGVYFTGWQVYQEYIRQKEKNTFSILEHYNSKKRFYAKCENSMTDLNEWNKELHLITVGKYWCNKKMRMKCTNCEEKPKRTNIDAVLIQDFKQLIGRKFDGFAQIKANLNQVNNIITKNQYMKNDDINELTGLFKVRNTMILDALRRKIIDGNNEEEHDSDI